ncbi:SsrA-binding protein SmpB [Patescibacteria group bacterium]|nr:SsrA-binding protein SmpB [Patescibacteria group bacterium]MBU1123287.1 SsrA-binding protein SmpB [Patescibacteria group bacterium]
MKIIAKNCRARYDYQIIDTFEAGIILTGQEVKSCRMGHANLAGSYVSFMNEKPVLKSMTISPYKFASGLEDYKPGRDRPLLLKKAEFKKLQSSLQEKGVSVIPLEVHAGKYIKVLLGLGKGVKRHDKRQRIKDRETERKMKKGEEY